MTDPQKSAHENESEETPRPDEQPSADSTAAERTAAAEAEANQTDDTGAGTES